MLMEEYSFLHGRDNVYFSLNATVNGDEIAFLAYEKNLTPDPTTNKLNPIDLSSNLEDAYVIDFVNSVKEKRKKDKQLKPFFLEKHVPLLGDRHDYAAYTGKKKKRKLN